MAKSNPFKLDPYRSREEGGSKPPRRFSRPVSIDDLLKPWLNQRPLREGGQARSVFAAWDKVVGQALGRRARPTRFIGGELSVEVSSMVHLHELKNFTGESIRNAINQRLGGERVQRLSFKLSN